MVSRRMFATTAGAGQSKPGKFQHVDPKNAPRHDLRKTKHLPDPDLTRDISKHLAGFHRLFYQPESHLRAGGENRRGRPRG